MDAMGLFIVYNYVADLNHRGYFQLYFLDFFPLRMFPILINTPTRQLQNISISPENYSRVSKGHVKKSSLQMSKAKTNVYTQRPF